MRPSICLFREALEESFTSALLCRQAMHQQYLGPPGPSKTATKFSLVAVVTGLKVSPACAIAPLLEAVLGRAQRREHGRGLGVLVEAHGLAQLGPVGPEEGVGSLLHAQAHGDRVPAGIAHVLDLGGADGERRVLGIDALREAGVVERIFMPAI